MREHDAGHVYIRSGGLSQECLNLGRTWEDVSICSHAAGCHKMIL